MNRSSLFVSSDLQPGDLIVSRKGGGNLFQKTLNSLIEGVGRRRYGEGGLFLRSNHVRVCIRSGLLQFFHWTWPKSETVWFENWMLDPSYAVVCRPKFTVPSSLLDYAVDNVGSWYNVGLLLDIYFGLSFELFSLGLDNEVCSTGAAEMLEQPNHRRAIPADFLNLPELFEFVNYDNSVIELRKEPS